MHDRFYTFTLECSSGNLTPAICQVTLDVNQPSQEQTPNDFFQVDMYDILSLKDNVDKNAIRSVVIPNQINGRPIRGIDDYAFADCPSLTSIDLGSVTTIGDDAFSGYPLLTSVTYTRTSVASDDDDLVLVDSSGNVVRDGPATITKNDGGFLTQ